MIRAHRNGLTAHGVRQVYRKKKEMLVDGGVCQFVMLITQRGPGLFQRVEDDPCGRLRIEIGGFLGHPKPCLGDFHDLFNGVGVEQKGDIRLFLRNHIEGLIGIARISDAFACHGGADTQDRFQDTFVQDSYIEFLEKGVGMSGYVSVNIPTVGELQEIISWDTLHEKAYCTCFAFRQRI